MPLRRYVTVSLLVLGLHVVWALALRPYGDFLFTIGLLLIHANDISDIPDVFLAGFTLVGGLLLCATIGAVYLAGVWRRT